MQDAPWLNSNNSQYEIDFYHSTLRLLRQQLSYTP
jgi:hypothetical protein